MSVSRISQAYPDRMEVRGRDLTGDLMGRNRLVVQTHVELVPWASLRRSDDKSTLVKH